MNKQRMGKNPLDWIQNTQKTEDLSDSNQELQNKPSLQSTQDKSSLQSTQDKPSLQSTQDKLSLQSTQDKPSLQSTQDKLSLQSTQDKPKADQTKTKKTTQNGLPEGWTRATFIVQEDRLETLKALAYYQRRNIKEVLDEALSSFFVTNELEAKEAMNLYAKSKK